LNEFLISLTKEYTITAITKNSYFKREYCKEGEELALVFYWNILASDSAPVSPQLKGKIIEAFAAVIGDIFYSK
jgi:hypothetical protein